MVDYWVTLDGEKVEGPFETYEEAKRRADTNTINEVGLTYTVEAL